MTSLAPLLESFFTERLITQRRVSPHTVASYRDTFRLLLGFIQQRTGKPPYQLHLADLDAPMIGAFLNHLEHERRNSVRTRNTRLVAVHALFRYAAVREPAHAGACHPQQAIRAGHRLVPQPGGDRGDTGQPGPNRLDRPARPHAARRGGPDRAAGLRAHRAALPGRFAGQWPEPAMHR